MIGLNSGCITKTENYSAYEILDPSTGELRLEKYPCVDLVSTDKEESTAQGLPNGKKREWRDTDKKEWLNFYQEYMQKRMTRQPKPLELQGRVDRCIIVGKNGFRNAGTTGKLCTQTASTVNVITQNLESVKTKSAKIVKDLKRIPKRYRNVGKSATIFERDSKSDLDRQHQNKVGEDGLEQEDELRKEDVLTHNLKGETTANDLVNICAQSEASLDEEHDHVKLEADEIVYLNLIESDEEVPGTTGKPIIQTSNLDDITQNKSVNTKSALIVKDLKRIPKRCKDVRKSARISECDSKNDSKYLPGQARQYKNKSGEGLEQEDELREEDELAHNLQGKTTANDLVNNRAKSEARLDEDLLQQHNVKLEADEIVYLNLIESDEEVPDSDFKDDENDIEENKDIANLDQDDNPHDKKKIKYKKRKHNKLRYNTLKLLKYSNICLFKWTKHCFLCYECPEWFNEMQMLRDHVKDSHGRDEIVGKALKGIQVLYHADITDLECRLCSSKLNNLSELADHLRDHEIRLKSGESSLVPYKLCTDEFICQLCQQEFVTRYRLKKHMDGHYLNYVCHKCNKVFPSCGTLKTHSLIHIKDVKEISGATLNFDKYRCRSKGRPIISAIARFKCSHCPAEFRTDYKRLQHLIEEHNKESKFYQCEFCPKIFMTVHWLMKHMNYVHKDELYS